MLRDCNYPKDRVVLEIKHICSNVSSRNSTKPLLGAPGSGWRVWAFGPVCAAVPTGQVESPTKSCREESARIGLPGGP